MFEATVANLQQKMDESNLPSDMNQQMQARMAENKGFICIENLGEQDPSSYNEDKTVYDWTPLTHSTEIKGQKKDGVLHGLGARISPGAEAVVVGFWWNDWPVGDHIKITKDKVFLANIGCGQCSSC